ncbi:hypothetical protein MPL3356_180087 [Mesorhizobium plurifarium]|uniref:Uncharacterized protein n=1 Tax=Mesorhizobium plurifarium TaxID=69974 RepID=A0A090DHQ8_MESPL|nr:hypothetical protein MPL3356_180087 [Mesorhizobium plurifarium]
MTATSALLLERALNKLWMTRRKSMKNLRISWQANLGSCRGEGVPTSATLNMPAKHYW